MHWISWRSLFSLCGEAGLHQLCSRPRNTWPSCTCVATMFRVSLVQMKGYALQQRHSPIPVMYCSSPSEIRRTLFWRARNERFRMFFAACSSGSSRHASRPSMRA
jgi:hypothetical protein